MQGKGPQDEAVEVVKVLALQAMVECFDFWVTGTLQCDVFYNLTYILRFFQLLFGKMIVEDKRGSERQHSVKVQMRKSHFLDQEGGVVMRRSK